MAQVPSFKRIIREKFPSELKWLDFLLSPLNSFMEDISLAFNKRLTIGENFDGEIKTFTVNGVYPIKLAWGRTSKPSIGFIGKVERIGGAEVSLSAAISPVWKFNQQGDVEITDIVGLDDSDSKKYSITMTFLVE